MFPLFLLCVNKWISNSKNTLPTEKTKTSLIVTFRTIPSAPIIKKDVKRAKISSFRIFTKDRKFYFSKIKYGVMAGFIQFTRVFNP